MKDYTLTIVTAAALIVAFYSESNSQQAESQPLMPTIERSVAPAPTPGELVKSASRVWLFGPDMIPLPAGTYQLVTLHGNGSDPTGIAIEQGKAGIGTPPTDPPTDPPTNPELTGTALKVYREVMDTNDPKKASHSANTAALLEKLNGMGLDDKTLKFTVPISLNQLAKSQGTKQTWEDVYELIVSEVNDSNDPSKTLDDVVVGLQEVPGASLIPIDIDMIMEIIQFIIKLIEMFGKNMEVMGATAAQAMDALSPE